jgi:2-oxoisovalerate dehydrogenase E1 component beta subunit
MDTPIAEETIVGTAIGSAMEGLRPVAEFQYADFMTSGFDEITTTLARYHYRSGVALPVVLRAPSGGGVRASNFHSTNPEPWYAHQPGLKVVCPAFPADAKGLLKSAIRDDNPVVYLEHKWDLPADQGAGAGGSGVPDPPGQGPTSSARGPT